MIGEARVAVPDAVVDLQCAPGLAAPAHADVTAWVGAALRHARAPVGSVTVRLVDRPESAELNGVYRGKAGPTNVLAFPAPVLPLPDSAEAGLGDVVVCLPVVADEAAAQDKTLRAHLAHLVVHGTLHLLGYDHDSGPAAAAMEALERGILGDLGFADPYADDDD